MQRTIFTLLLAFGVSVFGFTQTDESTTDKPQGTVVKEKHVDTVVAPSTKPVRVTHDLIRGAQAKLSAMGYDAGPADGRLGTRTQAAIQKFQADEKLPVTGGLDQETLNKLNIGGTNVMASAPADAGRGAKAAGHNAKEGHPIAAGKAMGQGVGRFGKKVGQGTKALVVGTKDKLVGVKPKGEEEKKAEDEKKEEEPRH